MKHPGEIADYMKNILAKIKYCKPHQFPLYTLHASLHNPVNALFPYKSVLPAAKGCTCTGTPPAAECQTLLSGWILFIHFPSEPF